MSTEKRKTEIGGIKRDAVDSWAGIGELTVRFADNQDATSAQVYRNGANQVRLQVTLQPIDASGQFIPYDDNLANTIFNQLYLIDSANIAHRLSWTTSNMASGQSDWTYTNARNDFVTSPSQGQVELPERALRRSKYAHGEDGSIDYIFYAMCPHNETLTSIGISALVAQVPDGEGGKRDIDCAGNTVGIPRSSVQAIAIEPESLNASQLAWQSTADDQVTVWYANSDRWSDDHNWLRVYTWYPPFETHSYEWRSGENWLADTYYQTGRPYPEYGYNYMSGGRIHPPGCGPFTTMAGSHYNNMYLNTYYFYNGFTVAMLPTIDPGNSSLQVSWFISGGYSFTRDGHEAPNFYVQPSRWGTASRYESHDVALIDIYGTKRWFTVPAYDGTDPTQYPAIQFSGIDYS